MQVRVVVARAADLKLYECTVEACTVSWVFNFPLGLFFRSKERTNFRWMKGTYLKANFRLWFESGWLHVLVGAELGQVLLTVHFLRGSWEKCCTNAQVEVSFIQITLLFYAELFFRHTPGLFPFVKFFLLQKLC